MNFPFFIARRYLFSKKSTHAINVISGISVVGVAVATMALVVTLSVFNGFHDLVASFFTSFDPQLKVMPAEGKTVAADDPILTEIRKLPEIEVATESVEDMALAIYRGRQAMVVIKGVDDNFDKLTHINEILVGNGDFSLHAADMDYGTLGIRLAEILGTGYTYEEPLRIYAPKREGQLDMTNPEEAFEEDELYSPGVLFNVKQARYDKNYILTSISFARRLFGQQGMLSSLELRLKPGSNFDKVKSQIKQLCADKFVVKDRFETDSIHLPDIHLDGGLLQYHRFAIDAYHRQERRCGYAAQPGSIRQADSSYIPVRGPNDISNRCYYRYRNRTDTLLDSTTIWNSCTGFVERYICDKCLSCKRTSRGYSSGVCNSAGSRIPLCMVSCKVLC